MREKELRQSGRGLPSYGRGLHRIEIIFRYINLKLFDQITYFMQQFIETRLMSLIKESIKRSVSITEWEQSYEAFSDALFATNKKSERLVIHNSLCYVKVEFIFWQRQNSLKKK